MAATAGGKDLAPCLICKSQTKESSIHTDFSHYDCVRCGKFSLTTKARNYLSGGFLGDDAVERAILSHAVFRMHGQGEWPTLTWDLIERIVKEHDLPTPGEQADNLIAWLGTKLATAGETHEVTKDALQSVIGTLSVEGVRFIIQALVDAGLIQQIGNPISGPVSLTLSFAGWRRLQELKQANYASRKAFMAMKFGDTELESFYAEHLRPASAAAGFELRKLDDSGAPAGLIDDRMRVEIRTSRFLIADLTHHNNGAYWEAGYAEGLGKPVIYTCRKDVFEDKNAGPHFDTNHHLTIVWNPSDLPDAAQRLTATIRATLPAEAKLGDDEPS